MTDLPDEGRAAAPATSPPPALSSADRRALRARAHELDPVVMVGDAGLTDGVVAETDRALGAHGLIKVRIFGDDRDARQAMAAELEARTGSALVQAIGKLVVLWRPRAQDAGPIGAHRPAAAPVGRRATLTVPKKLAAEGKPAPKRRARPGVARGLAAEPPARRPRAPTGRPVGPGLRAARGALDPSVARPAPGGAASGVRGGRPPSAAAGRGAAGPTGRTAGGAGGRTGAAPGARAGAKPGRGAGTTAPGRAAGAGAGRRGPGSTAARPPGGAPARGSAAAPPARGGAARGPASGASRGTGAPRGPAPARAGAGTAARSGGAAAGRPAGRPPASGATGTRGSAPARSGAGAPRGTGRSGTAPTGSGRPGPRTRAGRRGP